MPTIEKVNPKQDLQKFSVWIEDTTPQSTYFQISNLPDILTAGKNSFLINGASQLVDGTQVLVEIIDSKGNTVFCNPVINYTEGSSKVVSIEIYGDTAPGLATLTILGQIAFDISGNLPPSQFVNAYNVRWQSKLSIDPSRTNASTIRLYEIPTVSVTERLVSYRETTPNSNVITSGTLYGFATQGSYAVRLVSASSNFIQQSVGAVVQANINGTSFTSSISSVLNSTTALLSVGYPVTGSYTNFQTNNYSVSFNSISDFSSIFGSTNTVLTRSYADIELDNLKTFSGQIYRAKVYVKGSTALDSNNYNLVDDVILKSKKLLQTPSLTTPFSTGYLVDTGEISSTIIANNFWEGGVVTNGIPIVVGTNLVPNSNTFTQVAGWISDFSFPNILSAGTFIGHTFSQLTSATPTDIYHPVFFPINGSYTVSEYVRGVPGISASFIIRLLDVGTDGSNRGDLEVTISSSGVVTAVAANGAVDPQAILVGDGVYRVSMVCPNCAAAENVIIPVLNSSGSLNMLFADVDVSYGIAQPVVENLVLNSNTFTQDAGWASDFPFPVTSSAGTFANHVFSKIDTTGESDIDRLVNLPVDGTYIISEYVKGLPGVSTSVLFRLYDVTTNVSRGVVINIATDGTVTGILNDPASSYSIDNIGEGVYKVSVTCPNCIAANNNYIVLAVSSPGSGVNLYIADVEVSYRAPFTIQHDSSVAIASMYLSTNIVSNPNTFTQAAGWISDFAFPVTSSVGTFANHVFSKIDTTTPSDIYSFVNLPIDGTYTISQYLKGIPGVSTSIFFHIFDITAQVNRGLLTVAISATGVVTGVLDATASSYSIDYVGEGVYKVSVVCPGCVAVNENIIVPALSSPGSVNMFLADVQVSLTNPYFIESVLDMPFNKNEDYNISFRSVLSSLDSVGSPYQLDVYVTGSAFPNINPLGQLVGSVTVPSGKSYGDFTKQYTVTALNTGTAKLIFVVYSNPWYISGINVSSATDFGFNPSTCFLSTLITDKQLEQLQFKINLFNANNDAFPVDILSNFIFFNGGNTVIKGIDNRIVGTVTLSASGSGPILMVNTSGSYINIAPITALPISASDLPTYIGPPIISFYSGSSPYSGSNPNGPAIGFQVVAGGNPTASFLDFNSQNGTLSIRGDISLIPGSALSGSIGNISSSLVSAIATGSAVSASLVIISATGSSALLGLQQLVNGIYAGGTFISDKNIVSPQIGGNLGFFSQSFGVGNISAGNGIVLTALGYIDATGSSVPNAPAIYIGAGQYANANTPFFVASSSFGAIFSLGDKVSWNNSGSVLTVKGQLNVIDSGSANTGFQDVKTVMANYIAYGPFGFYVSNL